MDKTYRYTRIKLTLLYFFILFFIVGFFSAIIIENQYSQFDRIQHYQSHMIAPPIPGQTENPDSFLVVIDTARSSLLINTIEIDIVILLIAMFLSYFLAGETLKPIEESLEKQKQFVADASHELKTPLTAMTTQAEVLLKTDRTVGQYKTFAKSMLEETQRLSQLTIQLLTIAKIDAHQEVLTTEEINIGEVAQETVAKFTPLAEEKHVTLGFKASVENIMISCNKAKITQLIAILLDNAIKYNKEGGNVTVYLTQQKNMTKLVIKDSGIGIRKEDLPKIFDRFYRVSDDRHTKGFGLGLPIAKEIVSLCQGAIDIKSTPNEETTVTVTFKQ